MVIPKQMYEMCFMTQTTYWLRTRILLRLSKLLHPIATLKQRCIKYSREAVKGNHAVLRQTRSGAKSLIAPRIIISTWHKCIVTRPVTYSSTEDATKQAGSHLDLPCTVSTNYTPIISCVCPSAPISQRSN